MLFAPRWMSFESRSIKMARFDEGDGCPAVVGCVFVLVADDHGQGDLASR
jgi:hypothetical protein